MTTPVLTIINPAAGSSIDPLQVIRFRIDQAAGIASSLVYISFNEDHSEFVFDGTDYSSKYGESEVEFTESAGDIIRVEFAILRDGGWDINNPPIFYISSIGKGGGLLESNFSYTVLTGFPVGPATSSHPAMSPNDGETRICLPNYRNQDYLLDVIDRLFPLEYISPLKDPGPGYEIVQMFAKVFERVSLAIGRSECSLFITTSSGGYKSRGGIEFYRTSTITGAFTVKAGTIVRATKTQRKFVLLKDISFGINDEVIPAEVESVQSDSAFNVNGSEITAGEQLLEGEIDDVIFPILDPPFAEPNIKVRQAGDLEYGQPAVLDQHGEDRSILRHDGESDDEYDARIRQLPDTISPDAIIRQLNLIFNPLGLSFDFIETWENRYQTAYDGPDNSIVNQVFGNYDPTLFVYDDPRNNPPFRNRWLGGDDHISGIIVVVPNITSILNFGIAYDDPVENANDLETLLGKRANPAYDIIDSDLDLIFGGSYDGDDIGKQEFYKFLFEQLTKIKAFGTSAVIELEGQ